jgi:cytidyltransferase-like protein
MAKHIALFTGTFDPFHVAHGWQLQRAARASDIDEVVVAVIRHNAKKPQAAAWHHRVMLAERTLAAQHLPFTWRVESIENIEPDTVRAFARLHLGSHSHRPMRIIGADCLAEFLEDQMLRPTLNDFQYVVVMRPASRRSDVQTALERIRQEYDPSFDPQIIEIVQNSDISSRSLQTDIAANVKQGLIVPEAADYMQRYGLYAYAAPAAP